MSADSPKDSTLERGPQSISSKPATAVRSDLPEHVAIIMDGNGRWAKERGKERLEGHKAGTKAVRAVTEACREKGIRYLTLFSFSTENWNRSESEVSGLMSLFTKNLNDELSTLLKNDVRLRAIGDLSRLPATVRKALNITIKRTEKNNGLDLILAVSYGGREEIVAAAKSIATRVQSGALKVDDITVDEFASSLWSGDIPDPDLLIRTSGEMRISNFLLWQLAYAEILVTPELWPDFDKEIFDRCLEQYATRERRFGLTSEQLARVSQA